MNYLTFDSKNKTLQCEIRWKAVKQYCTEKYCGIFIFERLPLSVQKKMHPFKRLPLSVQKKMHPFERLPLSVQKKMHPFKRLPLSVQNKKMHPFERLPLSVQKKNASV